MADVIDLVGQKFGKLTVVRRFGNVGSRAVWECVCDCGGSRLVAGKYLRNGSAVDCGCSCAVSDEDGEIWKPVFGYEEKYEVSNHGRVKSCKRFRSGKGGARTLVGERLLKQSHDHSGYLKVGLRDGDKCSNHSVHQLVAKAFVPNPRGYSQINHKDEDKENNNASNLEWCTQAYNNAYGTKSKRTGIANKIPVVAIKDGEIIKRFDSARDAWRETGVHFSSITACCKGRHKKAGGFEWEYERRKK